MALPQLESLAASGAGEAAGRLQVSALPHTASSIRMAPFFMLKASSLIAWVLDQSLLGRATSVILISHTKGTPWPGLAGLVFSFLTRN